MGAGFALEIELAKIIGPNVRSRVKLRIWPMILSASRYQPLGYAVIG